MIFLFNFLLFQIFSKKKETLCKIGEFIIEKKHCNILKKHSTLGYYSLSDLILIIKFISFALMQQKIQQQEEVEQKLSIIQMIEIFENEIKKNLNKNQNNELEILAAKMDLYNLQDCFFAKEYYLKNCEDLETKLDFVKNNIDKKDFDFNNSQALSCLCNGEIGLIIPSVLYKNIEIKNNIITIKEDEGVRVIYLYKKHIYQQDKEAVKFALLKQIAVSMINFEYSVEYEEEIYSTN